MEPKNLRFGGGVTESVLNPVVLLIVLFAGIVMVLAPRRQANVAFFAASLLIPIDQVLLLGPLHFPMLRLLVVFAAARIFKDRGTSRYMIFSGGINKIDWVIILLTLTTAINGIVLFKEGAAVVFQLGNLYTVFGIYFFCRFLIRDESDVLQVIRTLAYVAIFIAPIMAWELKTGHNPYAILGGANASLYANLMARDDRFRALGCFGHPILAGTFGAVLAPLFIVLWKRGEKDRWLGALGIVACTVIVLTSNSSTPVLALAGGMFAICLWPIRRWMRVVRWGLVITVVSLHMLMKAPVWHLISRIDISGGSSGYHRFMLIDQCVRHFSDWCFVGVKSTYEWGWDMWDTANQYVSTFDSSGLIPGVLFIATIVYAFKYLGKARKHAKTKKQQMFLWILGSAMFAHVISFVGISYWDQNQVVWYGFLAAISAAVLIRQDIAKPVVNADEPGCVSAAKVETDAVYVNETRTISEQFLANP